MMLHLFLKRIKIYLEYYLNASTIYHFHPPYFYHFIQFVFDKKRIYYDFDQLYQIMESLKRNVDLIPADPFSIQNKQNGLSISSFNKKAGHSLREYETLYRISLFFNAQKILEFGSCLGTSAISLSLAHKETPVITVEGNSFLSDFCNTQFSKSKRYNCHCVHSDFKSYLEKNNLQEFDLFFLDGNHTYQSTLQYVTEFVNRSKDSSIIILDDIHWSEEMYRAWKKILQLPDVHCSLETIRWGFLFKNQKLTKGNYVYIDHKFKPWKIGLFS